MHHSRKACLFALALTVVLSTGVPHSRAQAPGFVPIGDLPGGPFYSEALGVSDDGSTVVGRSRSSTASDSYEACHWTLASGIVGLGDLAGPNPKSRARAASFDGSVVVGDATGPSGTVPFRWSAAQGMSALQDSLGAPQRGQAFDVSGDGTVVVGVRATPVGNEAFRWSESAGMAGLGWLPAPFDVRDSFSFGVSAGGDVVCGISFSFVGSSEPIRWDEANGMVGLGDVPGGVAYAIAWDVSRDGTTIVGSARVDNQGTDEAFVWSEAAGFVFPDTLRGATFGSAAFATSGDGSVVVGAGPSGAMIWEAQSGMRSLQQVLEDDFALDLSGWTLGAATGIASDGSVIVGYGLNPAGKIEGWVATIPSAPVSIAGGGAAVAGSALQLRPVSANPFARAIALELVGAGATADLGAPGSHTRVAVFTADGRFVQTLPQASPIGDRYRTMWDGRDAAGRDVGAGIYFVRAGTTPHAAVAATRVVKLR